MADSTYAGWQSYVANGLAVPPVWGTGPAWTSGELATVAGTPGWATTLMLGIYAHTSQSASNTQCIDVEAKDITAVSDIENWINARLALPGGYAVNRPVLYMNINGSYYVGAADDVLTPLFGAGYFAGVHYDLWLANWTNTLPSTAIFNNLGPSGASVGCVVTQYASYTQTGFSYDLDTIFDSTLWAPAVPSVPPQTALAAAGFIGYML